MPNPLFNPDTVQAAMLKHELSLIPQRAAFMAAIDGCGPGGTPAMAAMRLLLDRYPLTGRERPTGPGEYDSEEFSLYLNG